MLKNQITSVEKEAHLAFQSATDPKKLYDLKVQFLGKQGAFSLLMREFGKLPPAEKPAMGQLINEVKTRLEALCSAREAELRKNEFAAKIESERIDLTLPGPKLKAGARHPVSLVISEIVEIMSHIGYSVRQGPLIETDDNNFTALNIPEDHPARDMQDTFYIDKSHVLRTHTSPIQIRTMKSEKPPIRVLAPGSVFRCDSDTSHSPNFHQIEGLLIDRKVSMADLKGTLTYFVQKFFGDGLKTRFRPSYFQFTEPSAEVDCSCPICKGKGCRMCKNSGWIEIGVCGLVNPKVLKHCNLDSEEWQGFAFGFGVERMAIIKNGVDEIRLFSENDLRFLRQFQI
ncbi:MAG: phenylalanine--tRNA ligase subunit alpha [Bdellovibrionales bacterium]